MGDNTSIEWTDATVNFWWGCTKVGPGCDHCYAESFDKRVGGAHWGVGAPRRKIKGAVALIHKLDNAYADWAADVTCADGNAKVFGLPYRRHGGLRRRVFIQSMSDLFDLEVPLEWFAEAWDRITVCKRLDIQIVTKRISAVEKRLAAIGCTSWPRHAGLMVTVVNQQEADRDVPRLLALKANLGIPWVGLSIEPLLGPIDLTAIECADGGIEHALWSPRGTANGKDVYPPRLDWVIVGGESGRGARPMHPDWARSLRDQCAAAGVPFFFKQWGEWWPVCEMSDTHISRVYRSNRLAKGNESQDALDDCYGRTCTVETLCLRHDGNHCDPNGRNAFLAGTGPMLAFRVGKKAAGRQLDGVEHNGMPHSQMIAEAAE